MNALTELFVKDFIKLQADIRPAIKDAENEAFKRGGKASKYADFAAVWDAVKDALKDNGFGIAQLTQFEGETMFLESILLHTSGGRLVSRYPLKPLKQDPQGFGSAITYARRYALSAMLGVVTDDDDGNAASVPAPKQVQIPAKDAVTPPQDQDVVDGVRNWVDKQKTIITAALALPGLYAWLDDVASLDGQSGNMANPDGQSALGRLKRKAPEAYEEISRFYRARFETLSKSK